LYTQSKLVLIQFYWNSVKSVFVRVKKSDLDFLCFNPAFDIYTLNVRFMCAAPGRRAGGGGGA
jgi:hypothetical protein